MLLKLETVKQVDEKRRPGRQKFKPHKARFQRSQTKPERDKAKTRNTTGNCDYCEGSYGGSCGNCPASGKMCSNCKCRGHFGKVRHSRKYCEQVHQVQGATADSDSDGDFVFSLSSNGIYRPTVKVMIKGVKGRMESDSCATAKIMDYTQYMTIMNASDKPVPLKPATNSLYAYVQNQPLKLMGKFFTTTSSLTTDREVEAEFFVLENDSNSRPLLSLCNIWMGRMVLPSQTQKISHDIVRTSMQPHSQLTPPPPITVLNSRPWRSKKRWWKLTSPRITLKSTTNPSDWEIWGGQSWRPSPVHLDLMGSTTICWNISWRHTDPKRDPKQYMELCGFSSTVKSSNSDRNPIALTSFLCKVLERMINMRFIWYLE